MTLIRLVIVLAMLTALGACSSKFKRYFGPEVTRVAIYKGDRVMLLFHGEEILAQHSIDLGFAPVGAKQFEGDGRTPEGRYFIDRRNPDSRYYLSLGISYPNAEDIEAAREAGRPPGGDIFIHGQAKGFNRLRRDWTFGCIAVTNGEIRDIYAMVRDGTAVDIYP